MIDIKEKREYNYMFLIIVAVVLAFVFFGLLDTGLKILNWALRLFADHFIWVLIIGIVLFVLYKKFIKKKK